MCGLVGALLEPGSRTPEQQRSIANLFTRILVHNQKRGRSAAGVALIDSFGVKRVYKRAAPASELVTRPAYMRTMRHLSCDTTCLLGHARLPTKGSPRRPRNNHPLWADYVVGVHNGTLDNEDFLFEKWRLPRTAEVDSELLVRTLELVEPTSESSYLDRIVRRVVVIEGTFCVLAVDCRRPDRLIVLKHSLPLALHFDTALRVLFFSSEYLILRRLFGPRVAFESLPDDHLFLFDARQLSRRRARPSRRRTLRFESRVSPADTEREQTNQARRNHV